MPAGQHLSPWVKPTATADLGSTAFRELAVDTLVIGAGITGVTTALLLQRAGQRVAMITAERLGDSVTTHSTVKVTTGHGTRYSKIKQKHGLDVATTYARANIIGMDLIRDLVRSLDLDCAYEDGHPHVIYAEQPDEVARIHEEAEVATAIGLPVTVTKTAPLPFDVAAALSYADQAQFHPGRYVTGLAEEFVRQGGVVMDRVRATEVHEDRHSCRIDTTAGQLSAAHVVVATHYPFLNRGGHFARMTVHRSYGIAGVLPDAVPAGMTINIGSPVHSTRIAHLDGERLLIVVGESHEVGREADTTQHWTRLQDWARTHFHVTDVRYHWSTQDIATDDHIPFVGLITPPSRRVLVATGFDGWGMTNGTAAALLLRDLITGRANPWEATFDARRAELTLPSVTAIKQNVQVANTWFKDRVVRPTAASPEDLQPGEGAVMEVHGKSTAAYRDYGGVLHRVSAVCTHLRCHVRWNGAEKSWDCPCHGSRFGIDGDVRHGPATTPLALE